MLSARPPNGGPMVLLHPGRAPDPATFCRRFCDFRQAVCADVPPAPSPVLWLATPPSQLVPGDSGCTTLGAPGQFQPFWWADGSWREFPATGKPHALTHSAYTPRRFEPAWRTGGGLLRPVAAPLEAGPEEGDAPLYSSTVAAGGSYAGVMRIMNLLLCEREGGLWARRHDGGRWVRCTQDVEFTLNRTEGFEVCGGERYVLVLRSGRAGPDAIVTFDAVRHRWISPVSAARAKPGGHCGDAPVLWRPVEGNFGVPTPRKPTELPFRGWLVEATSAWMVVLAPSARDGQQRGTTKDVHSAVHIFGQHGEVIVHQLECCLSRLTVQRYQGYLLFVKDSDARQFSGDDIMNDDWNPSQPRTAAWLLSAEDVAVPPLPVHLPQLNEGWSANAIGWSLVLSRGCLEAPDDRTRRLGVEGTCTDSAPRLYLLEVGISSMRLWVSRRVDDAHSTRFESRTLDGQRHLRRAFAFAPLLRGDLDAEGGQEEAAAHAAFGSAGDGNRNLGCVESLMEDLGAGTEERSATPIVPALWSPDLIHAARIENCGGARRALFWRCAVVYAGEPVVFKAGALQAHAAVGEAETIISSAEVYPLKPRWGSVGAPSAICNGGTIVHDLPCFPTMRWGEADVHRPENSHWKRRI
eukprot:TRINITY_DN47158_c0_g1_i4.p1 TRINITY_DN47158_c0_g1~~TRINITY_DN47158_c0_g1_i4.p1  ORF type:complete len:636 (+),score=79.35 TRINITY_DN47158_c0_g1_i4:90-1997(+)